MPLGPRIIANTTKSFKTIDSEDIEKRCLLQADGQLVTESKKTTEHEVIVDRELPEEDDHSTGSREKIKTVVSRLKIHVCVCVKYEKKGVGCLWGGEAIEISEVNNGNSNRK